MSKLADRIRKATRTEASPIGFGAVASRKPSPTMLLLARFPAEQADKAAQAIQGGADVLLFEGDISALRGKLEDVAEVPVGVRAPATSGETLAGLRESGVDFVVFQAEATAAEALLDEQFGFVLALGLDASDTALRILKDLPLDALVIPPIEGPLTVQRQLDLKRLTLLSQMPLLVEVPTQTTAAQLRSLREAGVIGIIVDGASEGSRLAELRQAIDRLPPRGRGREERAEAVLPAAAYLAAGGEEEEEEEEEYP